LSEFCSVSDLPVLANAQPEPVRKWWSFATVQSAALPIQWETARLIGELTAFLEERCPLHFPDGTLNVYGMAY